MKYLKYNWLEVRSNHSVAPSTITLEKFPWLNKQLNLTVYNSIWHQHVIFEFKSLLHETLSPSEAKLTIISPKRKKRHLVVQIKILCIYRHITILQCNIILETIVYKQSLLATQIPSNIQVFDGIWVANIKYQILSNTTKYYMRLEPLGTLQSTPVM